MRFNAMEIKKFHRLKCRARLQLKCWFPSSGIPNAIVYLDGIIRGPTQSLPSGKSPPRGHGYHGLGTNSAKAKIKGFNLKRKKRKDWDLDRKLKDIILLNF